MARRAPPANRNKVEATLAEIQLRDGSTMLDVLDGMARLLGVADPEDWQESQLLAVLFETVAASAMVNQLVEEGASYRDALLTVSVRLGISDKTLAARLRGRREDAA